MVENPEFDNGRSEADSSSEGSGLSSHEFTHDPITSSSEDRLERATFARILGRALVEYPDTGSLVVALYGDWGSGKTSTLNMAFETIEQAGHQPAPLIVRFNPWWYSNTGELLMRFFEQLGEEVSQNTDEGNGEAGGSIKDKLTRYGRLLTPLGGLVDLAGGAGAGTVIARILEQGLQAALSDADDGTAADVRNLRDEISQLLAEYGRPVIVVIDDIDRLTAEEVRDVFKLVKAVADFPNTRYLLAFDRDTVVGALSGVQGFDGRRYLEKIVQVPFSLPDPSYEQVWKLVIGGFEEIGGSLDAVSASKLGQAKEELELLAYYGLDVFFANMRQVNIFLGSLQFTLPPIAAEVKLSDFVLLETLRLNHADAYEKIVALKGYLAGTTPGAEAVLFSAGSDDRGEKAAEATRQAVEVILHQVSENLRDPLSRLLEDLFPRVEAAQRRRGGYGPDFLDRWTAEQRVCVPEIFDVATGWNLRPEMISATEVEQLLAIRDPDHLRERLLSYWKEPSTGVDLSTVLRRMGANYRTTADEDSLTTLIPALLGIESVESSHGLADLLVRDSLKRLPDSSGRKRILLHCVEESGVTPLLVEVLRGMGHEHGWYRGESALPEQYRTMVPDDFSEVLSEVCSRIAAEASSGELLNRDLFDECLYLWKYAEDEEKPTSYLASILEEDGGVVKLLRAYMDRSNTALGGWAEQNTQSGEIGLKIHILEDFGQVKEAWNQARTLLDESPSWLDVEQKSLLKAFVHYYESESTERA